MDAASVRSLAGIMSGGEFDHLENTEVLLLLSRVLRELRDRELIRSENIVGDIGESARRRSLRCLTRTRIQPPLRPYDTRRS